MSLINKIISSYDLTMDAYYKDFEVYRRKLRDLCNMIIKCHPPGFFLYYKLYPEFNTHPSEMPIIDDDLKYFGRDEDGNYRWSRRRRVIKKMQKEREAKRMFGLTDDSNSSEPDDPLPFRYCTK